MQIPNKQNRQSSYKRSFALLGSVFVKSVHKMLMKLTSIVNFTNIIRAAFAPTYWCQKIQSQTVTREKLQKNFL